MKLVGQFDTAFDDWLDILMNIQGNVKTEHGLIWFDSIDGSSFVFLIGIELKSDQMMSRISMKVEQMISFEIM